MPLLCKLTCKWARQVFGFAQARRANQSVGPYDFKEGEGSLCFRVLRKNGIAIVTKGHLIRKQSKPTAESVES